LKLLQQLAPALVLGMVMVLLVVPLEALALDPFQGVVSRPLQAFRFVSGSTFPAVVATSPQL
jgi:hypothetical protein